MSGRFNLKARIDNWLPAYTSAGVDGLCLLLDCTMWAVAHNDGSYLDRIVNVTARSSDEAIVRGIVKVLTGDTIKFREDKTGYLRSHGKVRAMDKEVLAVLEDAAYGKGRGKVSFRNAELLAKLGIRQKVETKFDLDSAVANLLKRAESNGVTVSDFKEALAKWEAKHVTKDREDGADVRPNLGEVVNGAFQPNH